MLRRLILLLAIVLIWDGSAQAQSTGTLLPNVPGQFLDSNGTVCAACTLYSYTAGTTTAQDTFSDAALTVANTNPITLNSAGLNPAGGIYLSATNYKLILKTAAGATIWTRDNVAAIPYTTTASALNAVCDERMTLTTATPVTTSDVTAATTVYVSPYKGNRCALYDGSQWNISSFTELSIALGTDAANTNYDVFLYLSGGSATLERVAWSNDTTRATAITLQDGVYVKSGATARRYLGTYRTTAAAGQTEDSVGKRFVWNYYNRVRRILQRFEPTAGWTYTTAALRQANGSTSNQVAVVVGVNESMISISLVVTATNTAGPVAVASALGLDSTVTQMSGAISQIDAQSTFGIASRLNFQVMPGLGYHYVTWLEYSTATGTTTWYGTTGFINSGLTGFIDG